MVVTKSLWGVKLNAKQAKHIAMQIMALMPEGSAESDAVMGLVYHLLEWRQSSDVEISAESSESIACASFSGMDETSPQ